MKFIVSVLFFLFITSFSPKMEIPLWDFDNQLDLYFKSETEKIQTATKKELSNISDWEVYQRKARLELQEMFGLLPYPHKTPLYAEITGTVEYDDFIVEKLHFQSIP